MSWPEGREMHLNVARLFRDLTREDLEMLLS
jgi:hypothetical protein